MSPKSAMRERHLAYRRHLRARPGLKRELDQAITAHAVDYLSSFGGENAAAYVPLASEPGGDGFVASLAAACRRLFLPVSLSGGVLQFSPHDHALAPGALGIAEPVGARFNSNVLRSCRVVIVPALGVGRDGMRLGKGAGYYDRALAGLDVPTVAVVYEREFVAAVPHDPHDVPVNAVITERGVRLL
ncbi:5-formyltetrahydrofolate cyclo-ligase [Corynebacterium sanguinis]|nr:5-formyltetrahydrofolate cyclo-ligase [Corynebacterium sanguinis]MCT1411746.1 5-formyltetrahydrofolate cyclo-ligase [Corynebacterium sanguinis]MCT1444276.1 5-formyltetrahydrofolate cyclo-ligase [Corynebacterium sanguinis]MCT1463600.1 5-formyltetrahydrofolate cyclo-ligase [Corynebacterium sanguinis]MCT1492835.1 5-formyltetrahydrofolate cyclo-ligase [Corynebacterium sanguinis]MCT1500022.1 5-formyltetrahydrofolate cyclo-ligase [Corynebacterium sanguinis]